jgi:hypothetical protein
VKASNETSVVASLRKFGIELLASPDTAVVTEIQTVDLGILLSSENVHFSDVVIPLILDSPEFCAKFTSLAKLDPSLQIEAKLLYTAAAALQRRWWTTLNLYKAQTRLADVYGNELGLPSVDLNFGMDALVAVEDRLRSLARLPCNYIKGFDRMIQLYLTQLRLKT